MSSAEVLESQVVFTGPSPNEKYIYIRDCYPAETIELVLLVDTTEFETHCYTLQLIILVPPRNEYTWNYRSH